MGPPLSAGRGLVGDGGLSAAPARRWRRGRWRGPGGRPDVVAQTSRLLSGVAICLRACLFTRAAAVAGDNGGNGPLTTFDAFRRVVVLPITAPAAHPVRTGGAAHLATRERHVEAARNTRGGWVCAAGGVARAGRDVRARQCSTSSTAFNGLGAAESRNETTASAVRVTATSARRSRRR